MRCAVKNCNNNNRSKSKETNFFSFPLGKDLEKKWISFCCRDKTMNPRTSHICAEHFTADDFENNLQYEMGLSKRRLLKNGAIPTIKKDCGGNASLYQERAKRIEKRQNKKIVEELIKHYDAEEAVEHVGETPEIFPTTAKKAGNICEIERLKNELECLRNENCELRRAQEKQTAELKAQVEKAEKDFKIYTYNLDSIKTSLTKTNFQLRNLEQKLLTIFTKGQIAKMKSGIKRKSWTEEDIAQSLTLYAASAKLYKLLYKKHFPLPSVSTLQKWAQKIHFTLKQNLKKQ